MSSASCPRFTVTDCPVVVAYRVGWPDQAFVRGTLADIRDKVKAAGFTRTALILVGRVFGAAAFSDSRLYAADHHHVLRPRRAAAAAGRPVPSSLPGLSRQSMDPRDKPADDDWEAEPS